MMMIIKINYYFQGKEKSLKIFTIKDFKIEELSKQIDCNNLKYTVISSGEEFEFDRSEDPVVLLNDIKKGKISVEEAKNLQQDYDKYIKEIQRGKKR